MVLVETSVFTRLIRELLPDEMYRRLQAHLVINPEAGDVIPHSGGLRKLRWQMEGKGKRGGLRVIYYRIDPGRIHLLYVYRKSEQPDLTATQLRGLRHVIEEEEL
jgi:mRNA-degrading endonuclease RelE of RelBE toxin-antitoxin system